MGGTEGSEGRRRKGAGIEEGGEPVSKFLQTQRPGEKERHGDADKNTQKEEGEEVSWKEWKTLRQGERGRASAGPEGGRGRVRGGSRGQRDGRGMCGPIGGEAE